MRLRILLAVLVMSAAAMGAARAADPVSQTCGLIDALSTGGSDAGTKAIVNMAESWPDEDKIKLAALLNPVFNKFSYVGGDAYLIADLEANMQEHLIVMRVEAGRVIYIRLIYEQTGKGMGFAHIEFQDKFKKIAAYAFAQKPEKLSCG